jgi:transposase InsO family protein
VGPGARYLIRDRDRAFQAVKATAEATGIGEVLTAPRSPWQNAYAERFIGSVRHLHDQALNLGEHLATTRP